MEDRDEVVFVLGILLGEAQTPERAASIAGTYRGCPYCVLYENADCTVLGVFSIPPDHKWWLEWAVENPEETLGLRKVEIFFAKAITGSSPWSREEARPLMDRAPCGADCGKCHRYSNGCIGCPATKHYLSR